VFKRSHYIVLLLSATLCSTVSLAAQPLIDAPGALKDPMRPPTFTTQSRSGATGVKHADSNGYQLSAIRITREQRSAILNGKNISIGDRLGSARVTAIHSSSITLLQGGKTIAISLLPLSIKKPVEASQP
jgi:hypothetical protein